MIRREEIDFREILKQDLNNSKKICSELETKLNDINLKLEETEALAEICAADELEIKNKYTQLLKEYNSFVEGINGKYGKKIIKLAESPHWIINLLFNLIPKEISSKTQKQKIHFDKEHHNPKGFKNFMDKLSSCEYVDKLKFVRLIKKDSKTKFGNPLKENGYFRFEGTYFHSGLGSEFYVYTTAKTEGEAFLIMHLLNEEYSK